MGRVRDLRDGYLEAGIMGSRTVHPRWDEKDRKNIPRKTGRGNFCTLQEETNLNITTLEDNRGPRSSFFMFGWKVSLQKKACFMRV